MNLKGNLHSGFDIIPSAFRKHLAGEKSDSEFAPIIASTASSFNELSRRINRCDEILKDDLNRPDLAGMIRRIQDFEREKFEAVCH
jgi:DNA repair REX1-B